MHLTTEKLCSGCAQTIGEQQVAWQILYTNGGINVSVIFFFDKEYNDHSLFFIVLSSSMSSLNTIFS